MKQQDTNDDETYLDPVDTIQRPRLPMTGRVQNTGQRDKRYSTSAGDDVSSGLPVQESDDMEKEKDIEEDKDFTDDRKATPTHKDLRANRDASYEDDSNSNNSDPTKENLRYIANKPSSPTATKDDHSTNETSPTTTTTTTTTTTRAGTMRQQYHTKQAESFDEKIYEDLEEAMFSSSDDDDNGDGSSHISKDQHDKRNTVVEGSHGIKSSQKQDQHHTAHNINGQQFSGDIDGSQDSKNKYDAQSVLEKENQNDKHSNNPNKRISTSETMYVNSEHLRIPSSPSSLTSGAISDDSDNDSSIHDSNNPSYFALNRSRDTITLSNRILSDTTGSRLDDTDADSHDYDEPFEQPTTATISSDVGSGETSNESESVYEVVWGEDDQSKPNLNNNRQQHNDDDNIQNHVYDEPYDPDRPSSPVAIKIIPNTPRDDDHGDATDAPLPDQFSLTNSKGEEDSDYSDIGEEFEGNNYEGLKTDFVKPPDYSDADEGVNDDGGANGVRKSKKSIKIGNDTYETLSFDNNDENLYEELDTLNAKDGTTSSGTVSPLQQKVVEDESFRKHSSSIPVDTFYLKKLDAIIQEIRFGIGECFYTLLLYWYKFSRFCVFYSHFCETKSPRNLLTSKFAKFN